MTCKDCHHCNTSGNPEMLSQGYALCNLRPKWEFHAPTFTCGKWRAKG